MQHAFFGNGIYENILEEIQQSQSDNPELICYLQPYKSDVMRYLKKINPSNDNRIKMYISTTTNLNLIEYEAEIVGWDDKRILFKEGADRLTNINEHIAQYQSKHVGEVFKLNKAGNDAVNLLAIKNLKKRHTPFPITMLTKVKNDTPYKERNQAGGWSEVYEVDGTEPILYEEYLQEEERKLIASKYMFKGIHERLEKAPEYAKRIQVVVTVHRRNPDVVTYVLNRANGICEECNEPAPFNRASDGSPYLEVHHKDRLADYGKDNIDNAIAVCPNCHRKLHYG